MLTVRIQDTAFQVTETHPEFWALVNRGTWEPDTFAIFDRYITPETTVLDIGGWIGPTALYAAHRAKHVYAFEPDPVAFAALAANRTANPSLSTLTVINAAVAPMAGVVRMGAFFEPGDSQSSILWAESTAADSTAWTVPTIRLDEFLAERQVRGPLFVKIDIEGYEYDLLPALVEQLAGYDYRAVVSLHPMLLWEAAWRRDPRYTLSAQIVRRMRYIAAHWRLVRAARKRTRVTDSARRPLRLASVAWAIVRGQRIVQDDTLLLGACAPSHGVTMVSASR